MKYRRKKKKKNNAKLDFIYKASKKDSEYFQKL